MPSEASTAWNSHFRVTVGAAEARRRKGKPTPAVTEPAARRGESQFSLWIGKLCRMPASQYIAFDTGLHTVVDVMQSGRAQVIRPPSNRQLCVRWRRRSMVSPSPSCWGVGACLCPVIASSPTMMWQTPCIIAASSEACKAQGLSGTLSSAQRRWRTMSTARMISPRPWREPGPPTSTGRPPSAF
jgi:hypothetical protein